MNEGTIPAIARNYVEGFLERNKSVKSRRLISHAVVVLVSLSLCTTRERVVYGFIHCKGNYTDGRSIPSSNWSEAGERMKVSYESHQQLSQFPCP